MGVGNGVGVFVFLLWAQLVAFEMVVDEEQAVAQAVYPAGQAVVVAGGIVYVYGVAQEGQSGEDGYVACLQRAVGGLGEPVFVGVEEACAEFLQADDVGIDGVYELNEFFPLLFVSHVSDVVGDDGDGVVGCFVAVVSVEVGGTVVEDVTAYE